MSAFFLVARGEPVELAAWRRAATNHAAAIQLTAECEQWRLPDGAELLVAVIDHSARQDSARQRVTPKIGWARADVSDVLELHATKDRPATATSVLLDPTRGSVTVRVPFSSPDQAYTRRDDTVSLVTNDLRLAVARQQPPLDPCGVYALLQYGAIPAPFTIFRGVARLRPGHETSLDSTTWTPLPAPAPGHDTDTPEITAVDLVARIDDAIFRGGCPNAIFFSGGVDSSLLAARVAAAGIRDVPLLNYAFGPDDPETAHAERMALHLGMPFERIQHSPEDGVEILAQAARHYSYPFGDCSTLAMNLLARASVARLPPASAVLDGTGADGAFALGFAVAGKIRSRYRPLGLLPSSIGALAGRVHARAGLTSSDGQIATALRLIHRAATMPSLHAAVIAQNSLHGECFHVPRTVRREVDDAITQMVESLTPTDSIADRATTLDVIHVCGGIFAAKDFDPLRHRGVEALYPFLDPEVLAPSLRLPWSIRCAENYTKALLKNALARHVPPELVFRRKSGFRPPVLERFFTQEDMRDFIHDIVLRRDSLLGEFLHWDSVERLFSRAFHAQPVHTHAYNFLWVLAFAGGWIDSLIRLRTSAHVEINDTIPS